MTALTLPAPARTLYSSRTSLYEWMIRLLGYRQGLTRFFAQADFLRPLLPSCGAWGRIGSGS